MGILNVQNLLKPNVLHFLIMHIIMVENTPKTFDIG